MTRGQLSVVATPIGNLSDMTARGLEILRTCDVIYCEDTRVTAKLLARHEIQKPLRRGDAHARQGFFEAVIERLRQGGHVALVTDAGTPGVSDPGNELIMQVWRALGDRVLITPIPGPTAITAALSVAGFPTQQFVFMGFPPLKHKRAAFFTEVASYPYAVGLYESVHRINKTLRQLYEAAGSERPGIVGRELTKMYERVYRGSLGELVTSVNQDPQKGEYVIVLAPPDWKPKL